MTESLKRTTSKGFANARVFKTQTPADTTVEGHSVSLNVGAAFRSQGQRGSTWEEPASPTVHGDIYSLVRVLPNIGEQKPRPGARTFPGSTTTL